MSNLERNGKVKTRGKCQLTDENAAKIVETVAAGCAMETAAAYAGVNSWTFKDWLRRGRDDLKAGRANKWTRLVEAIEQARAGAEAGRIARVAKAGINGEWQADAWWLERTFPDRYGRKTRVEGTVQIQAVPLIDPTKGTADELRLLRDLLRKFAPNDDDPALSETARPALELLPGGMDVIEGEAVEIT